MVEDTLPVPELATPETVEVIVRVGDATFPDELPIPLAPRSVREQDPAGRWWISDPGAAYRIAELDLVGDTVRLTPIDALLPGSDDVWVKRRTAAEGL